jgi:hypothetical protein
MAEGGGELKTVIRKIRNRIKDPSCPFAPDAEKLMEVIGTRGVEADYMSPRIFDCVHSAILRTRENMIDSATAELYLRLLETANLAAERGYFTKKQRITLQTWTESIITRCTKGGLSLSSEGLQPHIRLK